MGVTISNEHPVLAWLVEYAAVLINKYHVPEGESSTAYEKLHGADPNEGLAYFCEKVFFPCPCSTEVEFGFKVVSWHLPGDVNVLE